MFYLREADIRGMQAGATWIEDHNPGGRAAKDTHRLRGSSRGHLRSTNQCGEFKRLQSF